jgi:hypothetical protein
VLHLVPLDLLEGSVFGENHYLLYMHDRWGKGIVVYSLIVVRLYYKGSSCSTESLGSSWDLRSCHCAVARRVALRWACLSIVIGLIRCPKGHGAVVAYQAYP